MDYTIYISECGAYILNAGTSDITFSVYKLDVDGVFKEHSSSATVVAGQSVSYSIGTDGVYKFSITQSGFTNDHISTQYCNVRSCLANMIEDHLCCCKDDCDVNDYYDFIALVAISNGFMGVENEVTTSTTLRTPSALIVGTQYEVSVGNSTADFDTSGGPDIRNVDVGDTWTSISTIVDAWSLAELTLLTGIYLEELVVYAKAIEMANNYCGTCKSICNC